MKKALIGAGGMADDVKANMGFFDMISFVDDLFYTNTNKNIKPLSQFNPNEYEILIAIGDSLSRKEIVNRLPKETKYFTFIHPSVMILGNDVEIGEGTFICAGTIITTNTKIGNHAQLNMATTIGHDCVIGDFFTTAPGVRISGNCNIGSSASQSNYLLNVVGNANISGNLYLTSGQTNYFKYNNAGDGGLALSLNNNAATIVFNQQGTIRSGVPVDGGAGIYALAGSDNSSGIVQVHSGNVNAKFNSWSGSSTNAQVSIIGNPYSVSGNYNILQLQMGSFGGNFQEKTGYGYTMNWVMGGYNGSSSYYNNIIGNQITSMWHINGVANPIAALAFSSYSLNNGLIEVMRVTGNKTMIIGATADNGNTLQVNGTSYISNNLLLGTSVNDGVNQLQVNGSIISSQFRLSSLNTAPISSTASGTYGEIRVDGNYIYVCKATNTWVRSPLSSF